MNRRHVLSITTLSVVTFFALVPGCTTLSVEGSDDGGGSSTGGEDATVTPTPDTGSKVDATSEVKDSSVSAVDAKADVVATKDASADVTVDVGKPPPAAGSACTTIGEIFKKGCGLCGTQEAVCESTKVVSAYGFCQGEVANGCAPGSTRR